MAVALVLALVTWGITDESATQIPLIPFTRHCWSTTAMGSESGPILQVPDTWRDEPMDLRIQLSKASSLASISSVGLMRPSDIFW